MSKRELRLEVIENRRMIKWLNNEMENQRIVRREKNQRIEGYA
jgi:hypothetical protein